MFGQKKTNNKARRSVRRFGVLEILSHALTVLSFLTLAATGLYAVYLRRPAPRQPLAASRDARPRVCPRAVGPHPVLGARLLVRAVRLAVGEAVRRLPVGRQARPRRRFNAGQKGYFWVVGALGFVMLLTGLWPGDAGAGRDRPGADPVGAPAWRRWRLCWRAWRTCTWARSPTPAR